MTTQARMKYNRVNCPFCGDMTITEAEHDADVCPSCKSRGVLEDIELDINPEDYE